MYTVYTHTCIPSIPSETKIQSSSITPLGVQSKKLKIKKLLKPIVIYIAKVTKFYLCMATLFLHLCGTHYRY